MWKENLKKDVKIKNVSGKDQRVSVKSEEWVFVQDEKHYHTMIANTKCLKGIRFK